MNKKNRIYMSYIKVRTFSGQTASSELLKTIISETDYDLKFINLYSFNRVSKNAIHAAFTWLIQTIKTTPSILSLLVSSKTILYINLGQGFFSFFRVLWWYLPVKLLKRKMPVIISLNGHSFMHWDKKSTKSILFRLILNSTKYVTVVGPNQQEGLLKIGVQKQKILIVPNTLDADFLTKDVIINKQKYIPNEPISLLFLSLLVESKGYPEYLEAIYEIASEHPEVQLNAILCGPLTRTTFCNRFNTAYEAEEWIESTILKINTIQPLKVNVKWIKGASGLAKNQVYQNAQIFVLPTYYPNEAQPLVLLEAMASGCAVITTYAGEISSTLSEDEAIMLKTVSSSSVAKAILEFADSEEKRLSCSLNGWILANKKYSISTYKENWVKIFDAC